MSRWRKITLAAGLCLTAGWIYWPALHGGWIWDDRTEMPQMDALRGAGALGRIWIRPDTGDYYPVKTTLEWLQWRAWGDATFGYHLTNVCLHALSALLLWRVLGRLGLRWAGLGAALFLVHPIAVESVAWIDELKNTLSLPFLLLAMLAYLEFDRENPPRYSAYLLSLGCFLLALLCKSSVVMFPCVLLLFAWWKRGAVRRLDLLAAAPFFALSLALGLVAVWYQRHHGFGGTQVIPFGGALTRTARAGVVAAFYLFQCILPLDLMPIYPRWAIDPAAWWVFLPWLGLILGFAGLWTKRNTWGRPVIFGLGFFFLNLAPVLGFIPISHMRFTWTMDHLAYLPLVGLAGLAAAGWGALAARLGGGEPRRPQRVLLVAAGAVLCLGLAGASRAYAAIFRSEEAFWSAAVERNPAAWLALNNLGNLYLDRGQPAAAVPYYERALRLNPEYPEAEYNFGLACAALGRLPEAVAHYTASLRWEPGNVGARNNLGNALLRLGRPAEAVGQYAEAVRLDPADVLALGNWGVALMRLGRVDEAVACYQAALRHRPDYVPARLGLGSAFARTGRLDEAIAQFAEAVRQAPAEPEPHFELGLALAEAGRFPEAALQYEQVLRLRPDDGLAREYLQRAQASERP